MKPYKKILDKQLWDDVILHSMSPEKPVKSIVLPARTITNPKLPSSSTKRPISTFELLSSSPFSTVINREHVVELSSWIDRKSTTYSLSSIPYEFQLILRGSRDDFRPKTFWEMCNGRAGTIVVLKVSGTDEILGGYNPLTWDNKAGGGDFIETNSSFIFSLKNGKIENSILSRVVDNDRALYYYDSNCQNVLGLYFGNCEFMMESNISDFTQDKLRWCDRGSDDNDNYYEKQIRSTTEKFSIKDYEVFKFIKKQ
ncbi:hypothetical protein Glove_300g69 [Diversispora epigaea]|uniref:TLDc domain-containing protein n=1 Tax=Diversispora epigaea TaxID=1348612 RepID=A0A397HXZ7_9GLOM|nr:hypothetical protein Glove_300g69 [Diversispora epigaea]